MKKEIKKVILVIVILLLYFITMIYKKDNIKTESAFKTEEGELNITFISLENSELLLFNKDDKTGVLFLQYLNDKHILETLKKLKSEKLDYIITLEDSSPILESNIKLKLEDDYIIDNIFLYKNDSVISVTYNDQKLCIYENTEKQNVYANNCKFVYILNNDTNIKVKVSDITNVVFYHNKENLSHQMLEDLYSKWIDSYLIKEGSYFTLKLYQNEYDVVDIFTE